LDSSNHNSSDSKESKDEPEPAIQTRNKLGHEETDQVEKIEPPNIEVML
jgi:hypothetical protein